MTEANHSIAFEQARLRTERLRILGIILLTLAFTAAAAIRIYLFGKHISHVAAYGGVPLIAYELLVLKAVDSSMKSQRSIPQWFWAVNVVLEMSIPALGLAFLASESLAPDYRPLATSWVLLFFPFLVLSTLRLSPATSGLAGIAGAAGYLLAAAHQGWHIKSDLLSNPVTHSAVPFFSVMILATGMIAALVAREIRGHAQAALHEADTQHQLEILRHDLTIARSIQQSLLPKIRPSVEGYEIAGWNRSADATGGDYFDWQQFEDGRLVVTLADVTGHGIGPALLASVCRAYARATFSNGDVLPRAIQQINHSFGGDVAPGRFATFVAAVCRPSQDELELLSAGHAPLFLYSEANGGLRDFPAHDVPLGILPTLTCSSSEIIKMSEGDILLLITDGFLEWENTQGEQYGIQRLAQVVRAKSHLPAEQIIAELYQSVLSFSEGTTQKDDLTAVVIKRHCPDKPVGKGAADTNPPFR